MLINCILYKNSFIISIYGEDCIGKIVDLHYIISRIINKYIGSLSSEDIYERELANTLIYLRESMWRSCGSSGGLCGEEVVINSLDLLKSSYNTLVLRSGAPYSAKIKIYRLFKDLIEEINGYSKRNLGHDLLSTDWLREPRQYRLIVRVKGRNIPREAVVEVIGHNHYSQKEKVNPKENVFNLAEGEYLVRLSIEGSVASQKQVFLERDYEIELVYQEPQKMHQKQGESRVVKKVLTYSLDPSIKVLYISIALITLSAILQLLR
ncbi:MAG: hypothetical protein RQ885_14455 [Desulfurococcales archaeon]|nr:hypothetical protein [Desulfurococcales archaeon]